MSYWKYRAYDGQLAICEGVVVGPDGPEEKAASEIILRLRQQGLQVVCLDPISQAEFQREKHLERLKSRLKPPTTYNVPPPTDASRQNGAIRRFGRWLRSLFMRRPNT